MKTGGFATLREDVRTVLARDPAARSVPEVLLCYPGLHALWMHRLAHGLWQHRLRLAARCISHVNRFFTGIEIHPGARIGRRFFIDHGSGVVIGETAEIGDDVLLYQGVVLGGTTMQQMKRHPTVESGVVLGAGAIALGPITIGAGARIGAGSVVTKPVPPGATVVGVPGRILERPGDAAMEVESHRLPSPVAEAVRLIVEERDRLRGRVASDESPVAAAALMRALNRPPTRTAGRFSEGEGI